MATGITPQLVNREVSWLAFNERVLQEAADPNVPLLERLKFLGIYSSNLDEFFRVRVSSYQRMVKSGEYPKSVYGGTPRKVLKEIHTVVVRQRQRFDAVFQELRAALEAENIFIIDESQLNDKQSHFVQEYFEDRVRPALVPLMLDTVGEFPYLENQIIYLAIHLSRSDDPQSFRYALIEVPVDVLPRFVTLPAVGDREYVIMLDDIIRFGLKDVFSIFEYDRFGAYTIKITRDAELDIDADVSLSAMERIEKSLKQRDTGAPVRLVYDRDIPDDLLSFILRNTNLTHLENIIPGGRYHNARDFMSFPRVGPPRLRYADVPALHHPWLDAHRSTFDAIRERDVLLHYPYHSFHHTIDLLREAAIDPRVKSIRMTLYRVARDSRVVNALINAVRNGKKVTVLLELQARFDEQPNIFWTKELEDEGAKVLTGVPGLKVHAKLCMISRKERGKVSDYAVVGTGNFNEQTAQIYTDHALLTADPRITQEVRKVFDFLEKNYKTHTYKHLVVSPFDTRRRFSKLIKRETKSARDGKRAYIHAKMNSLVDRKLITKLYEASQAGVEVRLIVRGICSLVPGVEGMSENIEVCSIVDKYLEHSRIFFFCNDGDEVCFISSADWMVRNLDHRVEVAVPLYDPDLRGELREYLDIQFRDSQKARVINGEQNNQFRANGANGSHRAQQDIYDWLAKAGSS